MGHGAPDDRVLVVPRENLGEALGVVEPLTPRAGRHVRRPQRIRHWTFLPRPLGEFGFEVTLRRLERCSRVMRDERAQPRRMALRGQIPGAIDWMEPVCTRSGAY